MTQALAAPLVDQRAQQIEVVRLAKERGVIGRDDVEKLHQLLTGLVGFQVFQVAAFVVDAQGAHAFAHASRHQSLFARAKRDAGGLVRMGAKTLEDHIVHDGG